MNTSIHAHGAVRIAVAVLAAALLSACASPPTVSPAARSELAPTGKLRVGLLVTNPAFVSQDGTPGEMQGVGVEIGRELAKQLGVAFEPVRYRNIAALVDGAKGEWDVSPIGVSPERTVNMDFTEPYSFAGSRYLVPVGSPLKTIADVDGPGHRLAVAAKSAQDAYLTANLKHAEVVRTLISPALDLLKAGQLHAYFSAGSVASDWVAKRPEFRLVEGSVQIGGTALAVAKGRPAGTAYAKEFIEYAKASGLIQQAIERAGLQDVSVAPLASAR